MGKRPHRFWCSLVGWLMTIGKYHQNGKKKIKGGLNVEIAFDVVLLREKVNIDGFFFWGWKFCTESNGLNLFRVCLDFFMKTVCFN